MKREVSNKTILDEFAESFCKIVDKHCKYIVCSGFVAISHGRSRGTEDIDMIIEKLSWEDFNKLHEDLIKNNFICMQSENSKRIYEDYLSNGDSVRYTLKEHMLPEMEIKFAKDEIDNFQLNSRIKIPFTGLDVYFPRIEEAIAFKEEYLKSDKDIEDAKYLRIIYEDKIDENYIKEFKNKINKIKMHKNER
jgi:predicted nucleotidyltransferase